VDDHPRHVWLKEAVPKRLRQELAKLQVEVNEEKSVSFRQACMN
jgi:RNA-directed DNA polymerase